MCVAPAADTFAISLKEAEAVGCRVKYSDYVVPSIDRHVLQDDKGCWRASRCPIPRGRADAGFSRAVRGALGGFPSGLGAVLVGPWTIAMLLRNPEIMVWTRSTIRRSSTT